MDRSHGFEVKKADVATGNVSTIAGGEQTGWRDGVGEDALFYGSPPGEKAGGITPYCEARHWASKYHGRLAAAAA